MILKSIPRNTDLSSNKNKFLNSIVTLFLFVLTFIFIFIFIEKQDITSFYYDSNHYWVISNRFTGENGYFSFLNYYDITRGYIFPFIIFCIKNIADFLKVDNITFFNINSSILFCLLTVFILPLFFEKLFNYRLKIYSRILFILIIFYFWRGHFYYPLSDFFSITSLLILLIILKKVYEEKRILLQILYSFIVGLLIYLTYNIRPVYMTVIISLIIFIILFRKINYKKITLILITLIMGILVMATPQILINQINYNSPTPIVQSTFEGKNTYLRGLERGVITQKYESNINLDTYPEKAVHFFDKQGESISKEINSFNDYFKLVLNNPGTFTMIYGRHFLNGLDIYYPDIYIKDIIHKSNLFAFINYTILLSFFFILIKGKLRIISLPGENKFLISALIIPTLFIIPMHPETRFYLPFFILCYGSVIYFIDQKIGMYFNKKRIKNLIADFKNISKDKITNIIRFIFLYLIFILICFIWSANTFLNLK